MAKDEENKKKMFNFVKRLKENTRRNQTRLNGNESSSNVNQPEPTSISNQNQATDAQETGEVSPSTPTLKTQSTGEINGTGKPAQSPESTDQNCSICLRENNEPALCNECFHCFCFPCIEQWSQQSNQCPVCRREYSVILYNIRSETEFDEMPVRPRRRANDFEVILPFTNLIEFDRNLQNMLSLGNNIPIQFRNHQHPNLPLTPTLSPLNAINEHRENLMTFTVTNINPPDQNGNRVIQRTFFQLDPNDLGTTNQMTTQQFASVPTPSTSLEAGRNGRRPTYNPFLIPETTPEQQPTILFDPTNNEALYRSLDSFFDTTSFSRSENRRSSGWQAPQQWPKSSPHFEAVESIFDRIFEDLTRMTPTNSTNRRNRLSFPVDNSSTLNETQNENETESRASRRRNRNRRNRAAISRPDTETTDRNDESSTLNRRNSRSTKNRKNNSKTGRDGQK